MANISKAERERRAAAAQEAQVADTAQTNAPEATDEVAEEIKYVTMKRDPEFYDEPHEAKVHPHEVSSFARGGWEIV